jgi:dTDP-glucose 4,6-dehydratase
MKVLVTGGLGFIGTNFIIHVLKNYEDYSIVNLDDELVGSNHKSLADFENSNNYKFVKGNITDQVLMENLINECDVIINFAAESHVDRSILNAKPFIDSNIIGVFTILEILKNQKKRLVHISTDEVFGSLETESADENFRFNPSSPYSASKASSELLINSYVATYGIDAVVTRCTNNYGSRQFLEKLIPKAIILAAHDIPIPVYNGGKGIRDWIFVDDHCNAIMKVLHQGKKGESYNISASNEIDVLTIIKKILSIMKKDPTNYELTEDRPGHDFRYSLDSSKIRNELGWSPKVSFEEGLQTTIEWYLKNQEWWKDITDIKTLDKIQWKS